MVKNPLVSGSSCFAMVSTCTGSVLATPCACVQRFIDMLLLQAVWIVNMINMLFWFIIKPTGPEDTIRTIVTSYVFFSSLPFGFTCLPLLQDGRRTYHHNDDAHYSLRSWQPRLRRILCWLCHRSILERDTLWDTISHAQPRAQLGWWYWHNGYWTGVQHQPCKPGRMTPSDTHSVHRH